MVKLGKHYDSNNADELGKMLDEAVQSIITNGEDKKLVVDASSLEYISSAGLRCLLSARKKLDELVVEEVSSTVYEIFETTGFTELLSVKKALRFVSTNGLEVIGAGGHGKVYRLDDETIIKVYHDGSSLEEIDKEREFAKKAFVSGLPSAIAYDVVNTEEGLGLVFEAAGADCVGQYIVKHPEKEEECAIKLGKLLREFHSIEADKQVYCGIKEIYQQRIDNAYEFYNEKERGQLSQMLNAIAEKNTMIHGDFHPGNVMIKPDGEMMIIDMADISYGNPLFDVAGSYLVMVSAASRDESIIKRVCGLSAKQAASVWRRLVKEYYGGLDEDGLKKIEQISGVFALLRTATSAGMMSKNTNSEMKKMISDVMRQELFPNVDKFIAMFSSLK